MAFWIRNTTGGTIVVNDLRKTTLLAAEERDLCGPFYPTDVRLSADLDAALAGGNLTRIDGPGGAPIPYANAYDDLATTHAIGGSSHTGNLSTDDVTEGANLYYTEGRVSANADVAANTTHRGSTTNPHATDIGNLGTGTLAELNAKVTDATLDDSGDSRTPTAHAGTHEDGGVDAVPHQNLNGAGVNTHTQIDTHIASVANPHSVTKTQVGLGNVTDDAQLKRGADDFDTFAEKAAPAGTDLLLLEDSGDAGNKKKVQVGNLPGGGGTGPGANMKANELIAAVFAGNPKKATANFGTAYPNTNYTVMLTCETSVHVQFAPSVENKTVNGFTVNMGCNNINGLVAVSWATAPYGEA